MKLFLASEGKHPDTIEKLKSFFNGNLSDKKVAYVVTAANGEFYGAWKASESIKVIQALFPKFDIVELENHRQLPVLQAIEAADILWVAGGYTGYLLYWMRRCGLAQKLPNLLDKGLVYVGSSAGSMACSQTQSASDWYLREPEPGADLIPGLGLIDFEIYPHYDESLLPEIKKHWKKGKLALLKDGEVITKINNIITWLGEERWLEI
jgi:peptidase E